MPRRVTSDSVDGGSSNDGSNPSDGSNTQAHEGSSSASPRSHHDRARRRDGSVSGSGGSDDGSGGDISDAGVDADSMMSVARGLGMRGRLGRNLGMREGIISEGEGDEEAHHDMELRDETGAALDRESILQALLHF